jgi:hypothetical protein
MNAVHGLTPPKLSVLGRGESRSHALPGAPVRIGAIVGALASLEAGPEHRQVMWPRFAADNATTIKARAVSVVPETALGVLHDRA